MKHKAPGKYHRKGLTLVELSRMFPDDATAERWFAVSVAGRATLPLLWLDQCAVRRKAQDDALSMPRECAKRFRPHQDSHGVIETRFQVWAIALYQVTTNLKGVSSMKLHRDLGITQRSARFLAHRLREAWKDQGSLFVGPVEVDETFIGGKEKNKHAHKKLKAGRGAVGKAIVVGAKDRETNSVSAAVVGNTDAKTLQGFVGDHAAEGATIYGSDDHGDIDGMPFQHRNREAQY